MFNEGANMKMEMSKKILLGVVLCLLSFILVAPSGVPRCAMSLLIEPF